MRNAKKENCLRNPKQAYKKRGMEEEEEIKNTTFS